MTTQEELTLLETAYTNFLSGGAVQSYSYNGRMLTRVDITWMSTRIDRLRAQIQREQNGGGIWAAQFRRPE